MNKKIGWIIIGALLSALPLPLIKKYYQYHTKHWLLLALVVHVSLLYIYFELLREHNMSIIYPYIKLLSIIIVTTVGVIIFNENINMYNYFGIILSIIALYLLSF